MVEITLGPCTIIGHPGVSQDPGEQRQAPENRNLGFRREVFGRGSNRRPPVRRQPVATVRRRSPRHRGSVFAEKSGKDFGLGQLRESSGGDRRQFRVRTFDDGSVHPSSVGVRQLHRVAAEAAAQEAEAGSHLQGPPSYRSNQKVII